MYNLNHESIHLRKFDYGKTQNIVIKVGRKNYYLDIEKNAIDAYIQVYDYVHKERKTFSKYGSNLHAIYVKNDMIIDKTIIDNIKLLEETQRIARRYKPYGVLF